jgi:hypothetical protein
VSMGGGMKSIFDIMGERQKKGWSAGRIRKE